mgnify:CR=1 FL=1
MLKKDFKDINDPSNFIKSSVRNSKFETTVAVIKTVLKDLNEINKIVNAASFGTAIYTQAEDVLKNVASIASQADKGTLNLKQVELMTISITELAQLIAKTKATNPLISDELVTSLDRTVDDANTALKLTILTLE